MCLTRKYNKRKAAPDEWIGAAFLLLGSANAYCMTIRVISRIFRLEMLRKYMPLGS